DTVVLGAAVTYTTLLGDELARLLPALAQAARTVGSPQIRNTGTIGGNLVTGSPAGDTLPVLVALEATAVRAPPARGGSEFPKIGVRNAMVIAVANCALVVDRERRALRCGLGSVGPVPIRDEGAELW